MKIAGHGQIAQMTLPDGWEEGERREGPAARLLIQYSPPESPDVKLCFFYRGGPSTEASSAAFSRIIKEESHKLSRNEYDELRDTLGSIAYPGAYKHSSRQTLDLNGKQVLVIEGQWQSNQNKSYEIFVDADGSGRFVQQIYYIAPGQDYDRFLPVVSKSLSTLQWL